jgi:lysophospholipid acyltransferase 7
MMLTLKLVGLAFEVNTTYNSQKKRDNSEKSQNEKDEDEANRIDPTCVDIFHYAFNYVGVLTGPYYRYRTFVDFLNLPFAEHADWKRGTFDKLKFVPLYAVLFLWGTYNWPLSVSGSAAHRLFLQSVSSTPQATSSTKGLGCIGIGTSGPTFLSSA